MPRNERRRRLLTPKAFPSADVARLVAAEAWIDTASLGERPPCAQAWILAHRLARQQISRMQTRPHSEAGIHRIFIDSMDEVRQIGFYRR